MDKIAIVFEASGANTNEDIKNYEGLNQRFCEVVTLDEIQKNPSLLNEYKGLLDCTVGNKFYKSTITNKKGNEFKVKDKTYVKTASDKYIVCGPGIIQLTSSKYSKVEHIIEKEKKSFEEYYTMIKLLYSLIRTINNVLMYEDGVKTQGIILNEVLEKNNGKQYVLVNSVPKDKMDGVIYITPEDIKILKDIIELKGVIV